MSAQRAQGWLRAHAWTAGFYGNVYSGENQTRRVVCGRRGVHGGLDHEENLGSISRAEAAWGE